MLERSVALLCAVMLAAACSTADNSSSASSGAASPTTSRLTTMSSVSVSADDVASSPPVVVVQRFDPDQASNVSHVVVAQDGSELATLSSPGSSDGRVAIMAIHQVPGAPVALVETGDGLATLDIATWRLETYLIGAAVEWRDPDARFLVVNAGQQLEVIDLKTLGRYDVGSAERFLSAVPSGDRLVVNAVEGDQLLTVAVDAAAGSVDVLDSVDMSGWSYDDSGQQLLARRSPRRSDQGATEFVVSPASEPASQHAWYVSSDSGPRVVWAGESLVVAEASSGRVLVVTAESAIDIGLLPADGVRDVFGDPASAGVLIGHSEGELSSWYHVDPVAATVTELSSVRGLNLSVTVASRPGLVVLDDADSGSDSRVGRVVAVQVRDGRATDLVSTVDRSIVSGGAVSDDMVVIGLGEDVPLQIFDLASNEAISLDGAVSAKLSPRLDVAAIEFGPRRSPTTSLIDLSTGELRDLTEGHVIAWLQP